MITKALLDQGIPQLKSINPLSLPQWTQAFALRGRTQDIKATQKPDST